MLVKFEQNYIVQTVPKFELFGYNGFSQRFYIIVENVSVIGKIDVFLGLYFMACFDGVKHGVFDDVR